MHEGVRMGHEEGTKAFFPSVRKPSLHLWLKQPPGFLPGLRGPGETQETYIWSEAWRATWLHVARGGRHPGKV